MIEPDKTVVESTPAKTRGRTVSKREQGVITPKRVNAGRRVSAPPANRREAAAQTREARRRDRIEQREAMMRGDERALLPRDKGPDRALVRDIVDARRNASSYFFFGLLLVLIMTTINIPIVRYASNLVFVLMLLTVVLDAFLLSRLVKRKVRERLPKLNPSWGGLYFYAIMRATSFRRMRVPRPRVEIGGSY